MKLRGHKVFATAEGWSLSPLLTAAAVLVITVFTWSLAQAHGNATGTIENTGIRAITESGATDNEAALFSATPIRAQYRFRVYQPQRYDRFTPRSRLMPGTSTTD